MTGKLENPGPGTWTERRDRDVRTADYPSRPRLGPVAIAASAFRVQNGVTSDFPSGRQLMAALPAGLSVISSLLLM